MKNVYSFFLKIRKKKSFIHQVRIIKFLQFPSLNKSFICHNDCKMGHILAINLPCINWWNPYTSFETDSQIHNWQMLIYSAIRQKRNVLTAITHHKLVCLSKHLLIQKSHLSLSFSSCVTSWSSLAERDRLWILSALLMGKKTTLKSFISTNQTCMACWMPWLWCYETCGAASLTERWQKHYKKDCNDCFNNNQKLYLSSD